MGKRKDKKEIKKTPKKKSNNIKEKEIKEPVKLKDETSVKIIVLSGDSSFDGSFIELIGWRILGFFITILTFGLAYPFALCTRCAWQAKHTIINGKRLKFDGRGADFLGKWIWWCILTILTLGVYAFFIPNQKRKWIIKHTHYESYKKDSEEDANNKSKFTGNIFEHIGIWLLAVFITIFSFGIFLPVSIYMMYIWQVRHTVYDGEQLDFNGDIIDFYINFLQWLGLTCITLGLYLLYIEIAVIKWKTKYIIKKEKNKEKISLRKMIKIPLAASVIMFLISSPIITPPILNFINSLKIELNYTFQDEVYTGQEWGDKYVLYLQYQIFPETKTANISIVNVDESSSPEIFIRYRDKNNNMITRFAYIKNGKVKASRKYKNASIKVLCTVKDEEYKWAIFVPDNEKNNQDGQLYFTDRIMKSKFEGIKYKKEDKEFAMTYVMRDIQITYSEITRDDLHDDMNSLIGNYEGDNYITSNFENDTKKLVDAAKEEIEKSKRVQVGDYFSKYGTYKLYTNNLRSTIELTEDDEVLELRKDKTCHIKRSSKLNQEIDKECTYAVQETNNIIDSKKIYNLVISFEGGSTTYSVTANNELTSSWYKLKLK